MEDGKGFKELSNFFPRQIQAVEMSKVFDYLLYGGTLGGGKSRFIRWIPLYWLLKWHGELGISGIRVGVFCEDYPSLNDRHLSYIKSEFPPWLGKFNEQKHEFTLRPEYGSGVIAFRNLDDPEKYLSVEFALIAIDEINRNPESIFNTLRRRLRWPGIDRPKFIGCCNPIGEQWVRDYWIDRIFPKELEPIKDKFHFLESKPEDNPHLPQSYYDDLKTQDEQFVKAALSGDWHAYDTIVDKEGYMPLLLSNILQNALQAHVEHAGVKGILVDPAAGGDESAIVLASEISKEVLFSQKLEDTMSLLGMAIRAYRAHDCDFMAIDAAGLGQPLVKRAKELGINVVAVNFGEKPDDELRFADNKTELFYLEKEWLAQGGQLKEHTRWKEWNNIKYRIDSGGMIDLEPKSRLRKKGLPSPDVIDAAVLWHAVDIAKLKRKKHLAQYGQPAYKDNVTDLWRQK